MSLRAILLLGPSFFRGLRKLPNFLYKAPKTVQFLRASVGPTAGLKSRRFFNLLGSFANTESLVGTVRRSITAASSYRRPNSLLRAYGGLAGSVRLRNQIVRLPDHSYTTINKLSEQPKRSWFQGLLSSFTRVPRLPSLSDQPFPLSPKALLGAGCNSAVWAADLTGLNGQNYELAVKVLYNYYVSPSTVGAADSSGKGMSFQRSEASPVDWILLRRQLERECTLRPSSGHPNIVPIIGQFLDRTPASSSYREADSESITTLLGSNNSGEISGQHVHDTGRASQKWVGADAFPDGFVKHSLTYYLLMPRFDATLGDLFNGRWRPLDGGDTLSGTSTPSFVLLSEGSLGSLSSVPSPIVPVGGNPPSRNAQLLSVDDAVAVAAQLFDAVAELEYHGVAHRDIKPNNILIRRRTPRASVWPIAATGLDWLDDREVLVTNTNFHVALTDFGCAVRTRNPNLIQSPSRLSEVFARLLQLENPKDARADDAVLAHSGNVALLAPEIASVLQHSSLTGADYAKADLWAMATLVYPLFGVNNPFLDSTLNSTDYNESDLPALPGEAPGIVSWLIQQCLKRSPHSRPNADLVADVLHTWCIVRHAHRRKNVVRSSSEGGKGPGEQDELFSVDLLDQLLSADSTHSLAPSTAAYLRTLLDVSWASDWLTGPARPPDGLRVSFYRRVTLGRFAHCLQIVYQAEANRAAQLARQVSATLLSSSSHTVSG